MDRLKAKSKVREVTIRDMLFADAAALVTYTEIGIQRSLDRYSKACDEFRLTISLKTTTRVTQDAEPTHININNYEIEVFNQFKYFF